MARQCQCAECEAKCPVAMCELLPLPSHRPTDVERIRRLPASVCPPDSNNRTRRHFVAILKRLNWLSLCIRTREPRRSTYYMEEFDALVWALSRIVGTEMVDRWMGVFEIEVQGYPNHRNADFARAADVGKGGEI